MEQVTLTINGSKVTVPVGTTLLQAAKKLKIDIPTLCYDKRLSPYGGCKMCVVEIYGMDEIQTSCTTEAKEGMVVETETEALNAARKNVLELLLVKHPCDCLTCEKTGNCLLQNYAYKYRIKRVDYVQSVSDDQIDDSNPFIVKDNSKCILCGRCIRACKEIKEQSVLSFIECGTQTIVATPTNGPLAQSECVYCHNCVAVCPTGALTDKYLSKKGRWWEFKKETIVCPFCANGCSFYLMKKDDKIVSVTVGEAAPGRPFCLRGRLALTLIFCEDPPEIHPVALDMDEYSRWMEEMGLTDTIK